jgi:hypothetical protein
LDNDSLLILDNSLVSKWWSVVDILGRWTQSNSWDLGLLAWGIGDLWLLDNIVVSVLLVVVGIEDQLIQNNS